MFNFKMSSQVLLFQNAYTLSHITLIMLSLFSTKHRFSVHYFWNTLSSL